MKRQIELKSLSLACVFAAFAFAIRKLNILVIPLPFPPLVFDFRGVPAFIGSCLVPYYYAGFIGWAASEFDPLMGSSGWTDFSGWIPACVICSLLYCTLKKRIRNRNIASSISIIIGQTVGNVVFLVFRSILFFYSVEPPLIFESFLIVLTVRSIITAIAAVPLLNAIEKALNKLGLGET